LAAVAPARSRKGGNRRQDPKRIHSNSPNDHRGAQATIEVEALDRIHAHCAPHSSRDIARVVRRAVIDRQPLDDVEAGNLPGQVGQRRC
jgi:hypothetical protein